MDWNSLWVGEDYPIQSYHYNATPLYASNADYTGRGGRASRVLLYIVALCLYGCICRGTGGSYPLYLYTGGYRACFSVLGSMHIPLYYQCA